MRRALHFALLLCVLKDAACSTLSEKEKEILDYILSPDRYDPRVRPPRNASLDPWTPVQVNTFVRTISSIDDLKMEFSVQLTFRQQWTDERLKFDSQSGSVKYVTLTKTKLVWMPDLFFSNENEGHFHDMMTPNLYFRIFPTGDVLFSRRLSLTLGCPMNFKSYPMDQQVCSIRMASYGYTSAQVSFFWKEYDPVAVVRQLHLPNFSLQKWYTDTCDSKTSTGSYSCLKVDFLFKRRLFYHILQVYLPSWMLMIISWTSFWFDPASVAIRLMLSFLTLMTMMLHASVVTASVPEVPYTKAIDVWTGVCLTFVFGAFIEFVVVHYLTRSVNCKQVREPEDPSDGDAFLMKPPDKSENKCTLRHHFRKLNCFDAWSRRFKTKAKCLDVASRIAFPTLFVIFNLVYWITYL